MKQIYITLFFILFFMLGQAFDVLSQQFSLVFHEYDDFPNIDEIVHGDFNNDGNLDYIITGNFIGEVKIGIGSGTGRPEFRNIEDDLGVFSLVVFDFDEDGDLDFVGSAPFEDASYVWLNDGTGNFIRESLSIPDYSAIHFVDLNNDGTTNVIATNSDEINIYNLNQGVLDLNKMIFEDVFAGSAGSIKSIDYDLDGDLDIVAALNRDGIVLFRQDGNFNFTELNLFSDTSNDDDLHFIELNDDGVIDFVLQSDFGRRSKVIISTATGEYNLIDIPRMFGPNLYTDVADINNDGIVEILHADGDSPVEAGLSIFRYDNVAETLTQTNIAEDHADTEDGGIVDIDGDGDLDIYLYTNDFFDTGIAFYLQEGALDQDGDGFTSDVDCDDSNPNVNPDQTEEPYNGIDDDCNSATLDDDLDQDGFLIANDCDDNNADINPDGLEIPNNGIDEDCDGMDLLSATHEISNTRLHLFPNPATDNINIDVDGELNFQTNLYDLNGKLYHTSTNDNLINIISIPSGTYIIEIIDNDSGQKIVEKIVIEK